LSIQKFSFGHTQASASLALAKYQPHPRITWLTIILVVNEDTAVFRESLNRLKEGEFMLVIKKFHSNYANKTA